MSALAALSHTVELTAPPVTAKVLRAAGRLAVLFCLGCTTPHRGTVVQRWNPVNNLPSAIAAPIMAIPNHAADLGWRSLHPLGVVSLLLVESFAILQTLVWPLEEIAEASGLEIRTPHSFTQLTTGEYWPRTRLVAGGHLTPNEDTEIRGQQPLDSFDLADFVRGDRFIASTRFGDSECYFFASKKFNDKKREWERTLTATTILFVPGFFGHPIEFAECAFHLAAAGCDVILLAPPGHSRYTPTDEWTFKFGDYAAWLEEVFDLLDENGLLHARRRMVAHSAGAEIVAQFLLSRAERQLPVPFDSLALVNPWMPSIYNGGDRISKNVDLLKNTVVHWTRDDNQAASNCPTALMLGAAWHEDYGSLFPKEEPDKACQDRREEWESARKYLSRLALYRSIPVLIPWLWELWNYRYADGLRSTQRTQRAVLKNPCYQSRESERWKVAWKELPDSFRVAFFTAGEDKQIFTDGQHELFKHAVYLLEEDSIKALTNRLGREPTLSEIKQAVQKLQQYEDPCGFLPSGGHLVLVTHPKELALALTGFFGL